MVVKRRKKIFFYDSCWLLVPVLLLFGCNQNKDYTVDESSSLKMLEDKRIFDGKPNTTNYSVVDDFGRHVILKKSAERIVALSPHIVENLFSAGLGDKIVATVDYANYPIAAKSIPRVGGFANFSLEAIVAYQPDLVVGWGSGYKGFEQLVKKLDKLGIAVYIDEPNNMADISRSIIHLAQLGATESYAQIRVSQFEKNLVALKTQYAQSEKLRLFYQIWPKPLQTLNGEHIVNDVINLCGASNIFADASVLAPIVNIEALLDRDPQIIVASASNNLRPAWLDDWQRWPLLSAVKNGQLYFIPGDFLSRHTLRMLDGAKMLCKKVDRARRQLASHVGQVNDE